MHIIRYTSDYASQWDAFVEMSKNGTFLFKRAYMDYHSDRFEDFSLMLFSGNKLLALLPANKDGNILKSHGGLTYGGWIMPTRHFDVSVMLKGWGLMSDFLIKNGIKRIIYKSIPHIYHSYPAEEDIYAIFRNDGKLTASFVSTTIQLSNRLPFNENARRNLKQALNAGVEIQESTDYTAYWDILSKLLEEKYGTSPVHSLAEIEKLHNLFPENIKLYTATLSGNCIAGVVMYYTTTVAHAQYIAASPQGKIVNALPLLFDYIINNECGDRQYFDFGTSNEDGGRFLNEGLVRQKCGMGGRAIAYNIYEIDLYD